MRRKSIHVAAIGVALIAVTAMLATPAFARTKDDIIALQERMNRIEQRLLGQSSQTVRISELESQIQGLTGLIEELTFQLDIANQRLDAVSAVLAGDSLGAAEAANRPPLSGGQIGGGVARGPVDLTSGDPIADQLRNVETDDALSPEPDTSDIALPLNANAAYDYASSFLLRGDYQRAKAAFELYIQAFPNHPRTADAQFRLGEIYLALGENASAADSFIGHIRQYPNNPRAAEAYLKLGTAFSRLDKPDEACTVFKTMKAKYPSAGAAVDQRANLEMMRINCQ